MTFLKFNDNLFYLFQVIWTFVYIISGRKSVRIFSVRLIFIGLCWTAWTEQITSVVFFFLATFFPRNLLVSWMHWFRRAGKYISFLESDSVIGPHDLIEPPYRNAFFPLNVDFSITRSVQFSFRIYCVLLEILDKKTHTMILNLRLPLSHIKHFFNNEKLANCLFSPWAMCSITGCNSVFRHGS